MTLLTVLVTILASNLIFSFLLSLVVYIRSQKYYRPLIKKDKNGNPVNLLGHGDEKDHIYRVNLPDFRFCLFL